MEELKILIEMVANLPSVALWVLAGFWAYKVVVIGSVYGVIRLGINKLHSWLTTPKHKLQQIDIEATLHGKCITMDGTHGRLIAQIERLRGMTTGIPSYIHSSDVDWFRSAIDEKIDRKKTK